MLTFLLGSIILLTGFTRHSVAQLPSYDGQYGVGSVTLEVPVNQSRKTSNETFSSTGQPAFQLETVLFSVYYPASKTNTSLKASPPWLPQPLDLIVQGIAAGTNGSVSPQLVALGLTSLAGSAVIPAFVDVPIVNGSKFPVFIFSHGDTSLPQWYSRYLGQIAADGNIVAAITHRDGSNAGSQVIINGQSPHNISYITPDQLSPTVNATGLAMLQRTFRQAEVDETIRVLQSINSGQGNAVYQSSSRGEGQTLENWRDHLDFDSLVVGGHSFGATSALDTLQSPNGTDYRVRAGITLDPGKESGPLSTNIKVPILIPDSEAWSAQAPFDIYGQNHFNVVKSIAETSLNATGAAWFMTLLGSAHISITDAGLIAGTSGLSLFDNGAANATIQPADAIDQCVGVSREFFRFFVNGNVSGVLSTGVTNPTFVAKPNSSIPGNDTSYWELHVARAANASGSSGTSTGSSPRASSSKPSGASDLKVARAWLLSSILLAVFLHLS